MDDHVSDTFSFRQAYSDSIRYLTKKSSENVYDRRVVSATSSEPFNDSPHCLAKNAVDLEDLAFFHIGISQKEGRYSAHSQQLNMLRIQGKENSSNPLRNSFGRRLVSKIVADRDLIG